MRRTDTRHAARLLARAFAAFGGGRLLPLPVRKRAFAALANRLARSPVPECRAVAAAIDAAIDAGDAAAALALLATAGQRPDLRAEKIVSQPHRYLWICNPKAASRSLIAALRAADPGARLIRNRTLEEVLAAHPEARDYFRFAFVRHPADRTRSSWADKHTLARSERAARRWFIDPWYGLSAEMGFDAFCRWLERLSVPTPSPTGTGSRSTASSGTATAACRSSSGATSASMPTGAWSAGALACRIAPCPG